MSAAFLAILLAASAQAGQADKKDRVVLATGAPLEGEVQKDTWKDVAVKVGAVVQTVPARQVLKIEYWDAPPAFKAAMASFDQEKWAEVLSGLSSAEEYANSKEKNVVKPRAWFPPYLAWYRGKCMLELGRSDDALKQFEKIRKDFKEARFLPDTYEASLSAFREKGDVAKMDEFEKEIDAAPGELKTDLQVRSRRQRAELLMDKAKYDEAKRLFETITTAADPEVATAGAAGVLKCLTSLKDAQGVEQYAAKVLSTSQQPALLLVASNALGEAAFEKKQYGKARDQFIQSVVRFNPGRSSSDAVKEHEKALQRLAQTYEELAKAADVKPAKEGLLAMAISTYRELSVEYPSGKFGADAAVKASRLEAGGEKKEEKK
jgi:tetratricopeptide (TPR) repeat protein